MKIKQLMSLALIGLAVGACKRPVGGEDPTNVDPEGKLVKVKLAVKMPKRIRTYAAVPDGPGSGDPNVTDEEVEINTMDVFFYDDGGRYGVTHFSIDPANVTVDITDDAWEIEELDVTEGPKLVYVGINLPQFIVDRLLQGYYVNEVFENINLIDELIDDATGGPTRIPYFNSDEVRVQVGGFVGGTGATPPTDEAETAIAVEVERLVAKVVVTIGTNHLAPTVTEWHVNGGVISDFQFSVGQLNRQMYVSPFKFPEDPNWTVGSADGTFGASIPKLQPTITATYLDVHDYNDGALNMTESTTNVHYVPENTLDDVGGANAQHNDVTFISVRAKFVPDIWDDAGTPDPDGTFYAVFTGDDTDGEDALGARYFTSSVAAKAFVEDAYFQGLFANPGDYTGNPEDYVHIYSEGYCYYRIYLNPAEGYSINRNTVYRVNINGVNYIGTTDKDDLPGEPGTPLDPGAPVPTLPGFPILPSYRIQDTPPLYEDIESSITVTPWTYVDGADYDIY